MEQLKLPFINDGAKTREFKKYALWLATPERLKSPKNIEKFAKSINVSRKTLKGWDIDPRLWTLVKNHTIEFISELTQVS